MLCGMLYLSAGCTTLDALADGQQQQTEKSMNEDDLAREYAEAAAMDAAEVVDVDAEYELAN
jgi:hypothetical protein